MAIPKINFDMTFKKGELLTAAKLNQLAENLQAIANLFPVSSDQIATGAVTSAKLASSAVTSSKIAAGAVTSAKLASDALPLQKIADYTRTTALPANSYMYVRIPSGYNHIVILANGEIVSGAADDSWVDLRPYDSPGDTMTVQTASITLRNNNISQYTGTGTALTSIAGGGDYSFQMRAEYTHPNYGNWPVFLCHAGGGNDMTIQSSRINDIGGFPAYIGLAVLAGLKPNAHIEVWGSV